MEPTRWDLELTSWFPQSLSLLQPSSHQTTGSPKRAEQVWGLEYWPHMFSSRTWGTPRPSGPRVLDSHRWRGPRLLAGSGVTCRQPALQWLLGSAEGRPPATLLIKKKRRVRHTPTSPTQTSYHTCCNLLTWRFYKQTIEDRYVVCAWKSSVNMFFIPFTIYITKNLEPISETYIWTSAVSTPYMQRYDGKPIWKIVTVSLQTDNVHLRPQSGETYTYCFSTT